MVCNILSMSLQNVTTLHCRYWAASIPWYLWRTPQCKSTKWDPLLSDTHNRIGNWLYRWHITPAVNESKSSIKCLLTPKSNQKSNVRYVSSLIFTYNSSAETHHESKEEWGTTEPLVTPPQPSPLQHPSSLAHSCMLDSTPHNLICTGHVALARCLTVQCQ